MCVGAPDCQYLANLFHRDLKAGCGRYQRRVSPLRAFYCKENNCTLELMQCNASVSERIYGVSQRNYEETLPVVASNLNHQSLVLALNGLSSSKA